MGIKLYCTNTGKAAKRSRLRQRHLNIDGRRGIMRSTLQLPSLMIKATVFISYRANIIACRRGESCYTCFRAAC